MTHRLAVLIAEAEAVERLAIIEAIEEPGNGFLFRSHQYCNEIIQYWYPCRISFSFFRISSKAYCTLLNRTDNMPPTQNLVCPEAILIQKFFHNQQRIGYVPAVIPYPKTVQRSLTTRGELVNALRRAIELEAAGILQYLYAIYSIPNAATGMELVRRGRWTLEQVQLVYGDDSGDDNVNSYGIRGALLKILHDKMLHFLRVNHILMAMGEPFYAAVPDFSEINRRFPIGLDLALEPFNALTLQRLIRLDYPEFLEEDLTCEVDLPEDSPHAYGSLGELYRQIREGIKTIPDLFVCSQKQSTEGKQHLFLQESTFLQESPSQTFLNYQFEVNDINGVVLTIDEILEQKEGDNLNPSRFVKSHFQQLCYIAEVLAQQRRNTPGLPFWNPAYPAVRNPALRYRDRITTVVTVPEARVIMQLHDECYFLMMQMIVQHFGDIPDISLHRSKYINAAIDVITEMMYPLGELLMTLPSGQRGRTAGPAFWISAPRYISDSAIACQTIAHRFECLAQQARACEAIPDTIYQQFDFYTQFFADLAKQSS